MFDLTQSIDLRAYPIGRNEEQLPPTVFPRARREIPGKDWRLDLLTLLALLILNSGLIMVVANGGSSRFEQFSGSAEALPIVLWLMQIVIALMFLGVIVRRLRSQPPSP